MVKLKKTKLISLLFIIGGTVSLTLAAREISRRNTPVDFSANISNSVASEGQNHPIAITFDQIGLSLPISPRAIVEGKWEDPGETVGYWINSPLPGKQGNSVMYGHNWPNLLAKLPKVTKDQTITVTAADGTVTQFAVSGTYTVSADQIHILENTSDTRLTIYTCTGFLDSKRFVVIAIPKP